MTNPGKLDVELIHALQLDGRTSYQDLARRLGLPRSTVSSRLQELFDTGTLRVIAAVDPAFLGQHVIAHVSVVANGPVSTIADEIRNRPDTVLVSAVGGSHDLIAELRVATHEELQNTLTEIRKIPYTARIETLIYTSVIKGFFFSQYTGETTIDDPDSRIIELLQEDGRLSYRALAAEVDLSPSAVRARVQRILDRGIMKISAVEARGAHGRQLSMGVGMNLTGNTSQLISLLRSSTNVEFAAETVGRFDTVVTLAAQSPKELFQQLEVIRALPCVRRTDSWLHVDVFKEDYARRIS